VILEATGGLEVTVASALATAGIAVAIVNPRQVRDFARATGRLAKTDRLEAEVLARFGEAVRARAATARKRTGPGACSTGYPAAPVGRDADGGEESADQRPQGFAP
jgi:Transposase